MYIKYISSGSANEYSRAGFLLDLAGLATGTKTTTDDLTTLSCNKAASVISGTGPTSGMYTASVTSMSDNSTDDYSMYLTKYHYAKGNPSSFQARNRIIMGWNDTYWLRFRHGDKDGGNLNYTSSGFWGQYSSTSYNYGKLFNHMGEIQEAHIVVNDTTFMVMIKGTGTETTIDHAFWSINDLEYIQSIDDYQYQADNKYGPFCSWWGFNLNTMYSNGASNTSTNTHRIGMYRPYYVDRQGTYRNCTPYDSYSYAYGHVTTTTGKYCSMHPRMGEKQFKVSGTGAANHHMMVPIVYDGTMKDETSDPRKGAMPNVFRTTDNYFDDGDVLLDGSTRYRVFRLHKTGNANFTSATEEAFYAFPENNVPYS